MKSIKKFSVLMLLISVLTLFMTGCSAASTVDTVLKINPDGTGERKINVLIDQNVFNLNFKGSMENLEKLIAKNKPADLNCIFNKETKSVEFTLVFKSLDEYKQKIKNIMGEKANIEISISENLWESGIYINENFDSIDLLYWLKEALINGGYADRDKSGYIFSRGSTIVNYKSREYSVNQAIYLNETEKIDILKIDILTEINEVNDYNREVIFDLPKASMEKKGAEIKEYFSDLGCDVKQEYKDTGTLFRLSKGHLALQDLEIFDKIIFGKDNAAIIEENVEDKFSPFVFSQYFKESFNFSKYITDNQSINCMYYVKANTDNSFCLTDNPERLRNNNADESEEYPEYSLLADSSISSENTIFPMLVQREYIVKNLDVITTMHPFSSSWTRENTFIFSNDIDESDEKDILEKLNAKSGITGVEETSDSMGKVLIKTNPMGKNEHMIKIIQKGSNEEIAASSELLYNNSGELNYFVDSGFWKIKKQQAFEEKQDYTFILGRIDSNFVINYEMNLNPTSDIEYASYDIEGSQMKMGKLKSIISRTNTNIRYAGSKIDIIAILFWFFVSAGFISLLIMILKIKVFSSVKIVKTGHIEIEDKSRQIIPMISDEEHEQSESVKAEIVKSLKDTKSEYDNNRGIIDIEEISEDEKESEV